MLKLLRAVRRGWVAAKTAAPAQLLTVHVKQVFEISLEEAAIYAEASKLFQKQSREC